MRGGRTEEKGGKRERDKKEKCERTKKGKKGRGEEGYPSWGEGCLLVLRGDERPWLSQVLHFP